MKIIVAAVFCFATINVAQCLTYLYNFNDKGNVDSWYEYSDVQRDGVGESKADFVLLESNITRKAVFLGLANSLTYAKGAATVRTEGFWDLSQYSTLLINLRGDAPDGIYFFVFNHKGNNYGGRNSRYRLQFEVPSDTTTIELPLSSFAPPPDVAEGTEALDTSKITSMAFAFDTTGAGQLITAGFEVNYIAVQ